MELVELGRVAKGLPSVMNRALKAGNASVFDNEMKQGMLLQHLSGKEASRFLALSRKTTSLPEKIKHGSDYGIHRVTGEAVRASEGRAKSAAAERPGKLKRVLP